MMMHKLAAIALVLGTLVEFSVGAATKDSGALSFLLGCVRLARHCSVPSSTKPAIAGLLVEVP